jgi:Sulfotransferase domain
MVRIDTGLGSARTPAERSPVNASQARLRWRLRRLRPILRKPQVALRHRGLTSADVVLDEYPRSGGTWLTFMLGEVLFDRPLDFESEGSFVPAVGSHARAHPILPGGGRLLRTHEPFRSDYAKAIYVVRHVCDVAVSYFHWWKWVQVDTVEFKPFLRMFLDGQVDGYGSWQDHVTSWLDVRDRPIRVVRYEDLRTDTPATLRALLEFVGSPSSEERVADAVRNNSMEGMREKQERARSTVFRSRASGHDVVRRGSVGGWREWLDAEDIAAVERSAGPTLHRLGYEVGAGPH